MVLTHLSWEPLSAMSQVQGDLSSVGWEGLDLFEPCPKSKESEWLGKEPFLSLWSYKHWAGTGRAGLRERSRIRLALGKGTSTSAGQLDCSLLSRLWPQRLLKLFEVAHEEFPT